MARRLRFTGSDSGLNGCPSFYDDLKSDEVVVQGKAVTDPEDVAQLRNLEEGETAVAVPRALFVDFAPRDAHRTSKVISFEEFDGMFSAFEHTAWRLETRRRYKSDEEDEAYRQFMSGQEVSWDLDQPWCVNRREQSALGKRFERARVVDDPPTPGQLYLLDNARRITAVGEDVRNLWRAGADRLMLPAEDFWLFDSRVIALLHFDDDDQITGVELITEPLRVLQACQIRDTAWHHAVPFQKFETQLHANE